MALQYNGNKIGVVRISQKHSDKTYKYNIQIRQGNCLCVMVYIRKATPEELKEDPEGKYFHSLYSFYGDEQHIKNIMKNHKGKCLFDDVVKIKLNMFYKEAWTLLKYFTKSGYKCECYYKEEKSTW